MRMRIGITARFQNSYFSGALPQVAVLLGKVLKGLGHDVTLLYPKGDLAWFIDAKAEEAQAPPREEWTEASIGGQQPLYDLFIETTWFLPAEVRPKVANRTALFVHYPPLFHDLESSVYNFNNITRDFKNLSEIWTWNLYSQQDIRYLEFLSGKPVYFLPFVWNFAATEAYLAEGAVPAWTETAASVDGRIPDTAPKSMSWCARVIESNISNTSHCLVPLNIVSEIRKTAAPVRFSVHNGEYVEKNAFFQSNVAKNLLLPDLSGNFVPRIRLPDLARDKSFIIAHQRFRPLKGFLLDALYCGIPLIHNSECLRKWGYFYELNQIREAVACWKRMNADYAAGTGMFAAGALESVRAALKAEYGLQHLEEPLREVLAMQTAAIAQQTQGVPRLEIGEMVNAVKGDVLRVEFCDMWADFNPAHNFFMSLLKWTGVQHGFQVVHDSQHPSLILYGPFGEEHQAARYAGIPKIFYTGENAPPRTGHDTFLNLGFQYTPDSSYIRLPLWVLEINWFGEDVELVNNPRPVSLASALRQDPVVLAGKRKFCAFVATNPRCQNRNTAFHVLNEWRGVDAGGRLFCNLPQGPVPAGLGGGGGELAKVDFYRDYKYVIAFENEAAPGYTTEKLFHAKVAGCVPIYWGDKFVDRDFDAKGFLNANTVQTAEDLRALVERLEADPEGWQRMAAVPALSEYKRHWCERIMEEIAKKTVKRVLGRDIQFSKTAWDSAETFHSRHMDATTSTEDKQDQSALMPALAALPSTRRIVTAANAKFIPSVRLFLQSLRRYEKAETTTVRVYVWPDVPADTRNLLKADGATEVVEFPVGSSTETPWDGFWAPEHYAWKLWIHAKEAKEGVAGTPVLYMDSGIDVVAPLDRIWRQIVAEDMCLIEDPHHPNKWWCHPTFCEKMGVTEAELATKQLWAGCIGFRVGGKWSGLHEEALAWAGKPEVICGKKWEAYTFDCRGHRHDQSILSILTQRRAIPRLALDARDIYCDRSRRTAEQWGCSLYVHRGNPQMILRLIEGIDEAYVINLERRRDRLESFKRNPHLKEFAYVYRATDGKTLQLTPAIARLFSNNDFKWKKAVMGCALSHFGLWQKLANDPVANSYLIMEDDVKFRDDWSDIWKKAAPHIPADADVIYLGGILPPNQAAFPSVIEPVNAHFAKVAKNTLFSGDGTPRRYFHFCNYAYVMTKQGAQKMMQIINQRGIFTSGDHMIVNHGDGLFNIYFTTPLIASCIQENDPVYQKSDFNNFARLDSFDSDLWNNNEHFQQEDIIAALADEMKKIDIRVVSEPLSDAEKKRLDEEHEKKLAVASNQPVQPAPLTQPTDKGNVSSPPDKLAIWNTFLRAIARNQTAEATAALEHIFALWHSPTAIVGDMSWFRIFEQLILTSNAEMAKQKERILAFIEKHAYWSESVWKAILKHWGVGDRKGNESIVALDTSHVPALQKTAVFYHKDADIQDLWEHEWLNTIMPNGIAWRAYESIDEVGRDVKIPVILYYNMHAMTMTEALKRMLEALHQQGKQCILLHISDEYAQNDISVYDHPAVKRVFRNYWRPNLPTKVVVLPLGYAKGRSATGLPAAPTFAERPYVWSFAGSLDRAGRPETLRALQAVQPHRLETIAAWGDKLALEPRAYCDMLRNTKFVPCLQGAKALESFRFYEAMEHGAIPVYVPAESHNCTDEMRAEHGADVPFIAIPAWSEASNILPRLAANPAVMEEHRQRVAAWWFAKKAAVRQSIKEALDM